MASIVDFFNNLEQFKYGQYCKTGANEYAAVILLHIGTIVFIVGKLTKDYSWVDRIWSFLPAVFTTHLIYYQVDCQRFPISFRQKVMIFFIIIWGLRLTYNLYRKGGYSRGGQDYRWVYIRKNYPRIMVELLNFFFTSYYQLFLVYWITSPIFYASNPYFYTTDIILSILWMIFFIGQAIADTQQYNFQSKKSKLLKQNGGSLTNLPQPYKYGFITNGLFRYSRHPNFFCQITMWWIIYLFSIVSHGWNLSGIGTVLLTFLFIGSTALTEQISKQKYPLYATYQNKVPMLIPNLSQQKWKES